MDSGIGGLCVLSRLLRRFSAADFYYLSDRKYSPYGEKTREFLLSRSEELIKKYACGFNGVIFACNTLTTNCIDELKNRLPLNLYGVSPSASAGKTLILCTAATKDCYKIKGCKKADCMVYAPYGLVPEIEKNFDRIISGDLSRFYKFLPEDQGYKTVQLSCTHFIYLKPLIKKIYPNASVLDGVDTLLNGFHKKEWEKWGNISPNKKTVSNYKNVFLGEDKDFNCLFFSKYFNKTR